MKTYEQTLLEQLETLDRLKERGAISDDKYEKRKAKLTKALADENSPKGTIAKVFMGLLVASPVLFIAWIFIGALSQPPAEKLPELDMKIRVSSDKLIIANLGEAVSGCQLALNKDWHFGRFSIDGAMDIPYTQIVKRNGERFNPLITKPSSIIIDCPGYEVMEYS